MPNQRRSGIVNVSFTMPSALLQALEDRARREMTNRSDIVRRALLASLPSDEAERLRRAVLNEDPAEYRTKKKEGKR